MSVGGGGSLGAGTGVRSRLGLSPGQVSVLLPAVVYK